MESMSKSFDVDSRQTVLRGVTSLDTAYSGIFSCLPGMVS